MKIGQIVNKIPVSKLLKSSDRLIDSSTFLGVEVEIEGVNNLSHWESTAKSFYWQHKEDHSLRAGGREFVFSEPLYGADVIMAIEHLCAYTQAAQTWKISERTGLHVHLDVRDLELSEYRNLCVIYALVEPLIYNWVGDKRDENMFCLPWYTADVDLDAVSSALKPSSKASPSYQKACFEQCAKYSGLNLAATATFGTVEFRHLKTTFDAPRIIDWLNIILSLKAYACRNGLTPHIILDRLKIQGPYSLARDVFGNALFSKVWYQDYTKDAISLGLVACEKFLDSARDTYLIANPTKTVFDWSLETCKARKVEEATHPGLAKLKARLLAKKGKDKEDAPKRRATFINTTTFTFDESSPTLTQGVPPPSTGIQSQQIIPPDTWLNTYVGNLQDP
jgi:hypothetical protein